MNSNQQIKRQWQIPQLININDFGETRSGSNPRSYEYHCANPEQVDIYSLLTVNYYPTTSGGTIRDDPTCLG